MRSLMARVILYFFYIFLYYNMDHMNVIPDVCEEIWALKFK